MIQGFFFFPIYIVTGLAPWAIEGFPLGIITHALITGYPSMSPSTILRDTPVSLKIASIVFWVDRFVNYWSATVGSASLLLLGRSPAVLLGRNVYLAYSKMTGLAARIGAVRDILWSLYLKLGLFGGRRCMYRECDRLETKLWEGKRGSIHISAMCSRSAWFTIVEQERMTFFVQGICRAKKELAQDVL